MINKKNKYICIIGSHNNDIQDIKKCNERKVNVGRNEGVKISDKYKTDDINLIGFLLQIDEYIISKINSKCGLDLNNYNIGILSNALSFDDELYKYEKEYSVQQSRILISMPEILKNMVHAAYNLYEKRININALYNDVTYRFVFKVLTKQKFLLLEKISRLDFFKTKSDFITSQFTYMSTYC